MWVGGLGVIGGLGSGVGGGGGGWIGGVMYQKKFNI